MTNEGATIEGTSGPYSSLSCIYQEFAELADFDGRYPTIGSWLVGGKSGSCEEPSVTMRNPGSLTPQIYVR